MTVEPGPVALAPVPEPAKPPVAAAPPVEQPALPPVATPAAPPEVASQNIAALPEVAKLADEPVDPSRLARNIQLELTRLGCFAGTPDGTWGKATKDAVVKFNRHSRAKLSAEQPSDALMAALRQQDERACPLICGRGYRPDGDTCVAIERTPRVKERAVERRAREREERRARAERAPAARTAVEPVAPRPAKPKGGAAPKSEFASPLCQSRIQVGSKWCCTYDPERGPSIVICR